MTGNNTIIYEHPINELTRVCLRLEQLLQQIQHSLHAESGWSSRIALQAMLEIVNIADRPDLKSNFLKELTRHHSTLSRLEQLAHVDHHRLLNIKEKLDITINELNQMHGKMAQRLRDNEFLNAIRLQLAQPGGACSINIPSLRYWLAQSSKLRYQQLGAWLQEINGIRDVVNLLLNLIRYSDVAETHVASQGFYEMALDPKQSCQLVRIELEQNNSVYPEMSAGRHRLCIRFLHPDFNGRDLQWERDVGFKLTCCIL